jgi:hypothetical protein
LAPPRLACALLIGWAEVAEPVANAGLATAMAITKPRAETISPSRPVRRNCARVCDT